MSQKEINIMRTFEEGGSICRMISCVDNERIYYRIETGNDTAHFSDLSEEEQKIVLEWLQWNVWPAKNKRFMTDALPHLLLYLAGIETPTYKEEYNILSPKYNEMRPRILKNSVDYDKLRDEYYKKQEKKGAKK